MNQNENKKSKTAQSEESILSFWQENKIFEKSLEKESSNGDFVFYDGPPFATGLPHYGHLLAGTIKDIIPRYKTMQGYRVPRKWGWDCHGLPIENLIEKELGLETKKDIEEYGVDKFNDAARNSVLRYESEWKRYVPRSGRFVDMGNAYMAMNPSYMESIWWVFGQLHKKGLTKEGFKAMHLCPRCETTLANFEVNQGYKDVTDISVTAKFELTDEPGTFMLAWTTTPWTLPGNVALAVGADIDYVKVSSEGEKFIVGKELLEKVFEGKEYEILEEIKGKELEGKSYIAPFDYYQNDPEVENSENGWKVQVADFVTTEDGTGIVHIAPAFGSDDMQLGKDKALPFIQHVAKSGAFKHVFAETIDGGDFAGMLVKQKNDLMSTDIEIIKRLAHDGKLFSKKKLVHSYPHCWRCDTPLLNYATTSWYVDVPQIKDQLIESNNKVHWVPDHVGEGRFGKWLEGARDWALSRSRFWGTPLPVWQSQDGEETFVAGSYEEMLSRIKTSGNQYFGLRHGESESNIKGIINSYIGTENPLTEKGRQQVIDSIEDIPKDLDYIFVSPIQRTQETAQIIKEHLGLSDDQCITDQRLTETNLGSEWEGKKWEDAHNQEYFASNEDFIDLKLSDDAESINDVYKRSMEFLFELEEKYHNKKILIVSHGGILRAMEFGNHKYGRPEMAHAFWDEYRLPKNAKVLPFNFKPFPHGPDYVIDIHRPYIDEVVIVSEDGESELKRIPDVFDVWFDSASMPYAQQHYPFENKESFENAFPAQFIAEGLDQTRGWFYVMTVIGNALFDKTPFENVIVNGLILAEDGKKMSKSLKNYPDPYDMFDSVGADAIRLYMINSPVVRAEEFAFSEKGVREVSSKVMGRLRNILSLYEMYKGEVEHGPQVDSENILDQWIVARLAELENEVRNGLEKYELDRAARPIFDFVDDFSTWYVRRSRDRYKGDDALDKKYALGTTQYVLLETAKIIAPFTPFIAEEIWQAIRTNDMKESVHLSAWPESKEVNEKIITMMQLVRDLISEGLQLRSEAKIKVRQPLQSFTASLTDIDESCHTLITDELNVKELIDGELALDTTITDELQAEGNMRELLRQIQSLRKKSGLEPQDEINLIVQTSPEGQSLVKTFSDEIKSTAGIKEFNFTEIEGEEITIEDLVFVIVIEK
ncbi:MAG: class I tRNA ligase family protein [Candidatus Pacebacteria bacterium]|nr:class I tRNA ligase family protein [Candidatus Paceibacterota bacterium]